MAQYGENGLPKFILAKIAWLTGVKRISKQERIRLSVSMKAAGEKNRPVGDLKPFGPAR